MLVSAITTASRIVVEIAGVPALPAPVVKIAGHSNTSIPAEVLLFPLLLAEGLLGESVALLPSLWFLFTPSIGGEVENGRVDTVDRSPGAFVCC